MIIGVKKYKFRHLVVWLIPVVLICLESFLAGCRKEEKPYAVVTYEDKGPLAQQKELDEYHRDIAKAMDDSQKSYEKRLTNPPTPEIRLPNYETGPGRPSPDYVNFYSTDERFPTYLLCEYPVNESTYDQAKESKWFAEALNQIRDTGTNQFPPFKWIAVAVRNRAEHLGATTFQKSFKVAAIFSAEDVFDKSRDISFLIIHADMDRSPFFYDEQQPTPGQQQRWMIVERHAAANHITPLPIEP